MSGLRINISKSEIIPIGEVENIDLLASFFGGKVIRLPASYLGLPLGARFKSKALWNPVIERFEKDWRGGRNS